MCVCVCAREHTHVHTPPRGKGKAGIGRLSVTQSRARMSVSSRQQSTFSIGGFESGLERKQPRSLTSAKKSSDMHPGDRRQPNGTLFLCPRPGRQHSGWKGAMPTLGTTTRLLPTPILTNRVGPCSAAAWTLLSTAAEAWEGLEVTQHCLLGEKAAPSRSKWQPLAQVG